MNTYTVLVIDAESTPTAIPVGEVEVLASSLLGALKTAYDFGYLEKWLDRPGEPEESVSVVVARHSS